MAGDISRDFARSLSNLHAEVLHLKKLVADQAREIEDLRKQTAKTDENTVKRQRARVQRAFLTGGQDELKQAFNSAPTLADEELIRLSLNQSTELEPINFNVNQELVNNMIRDQKRIKPLPVTITIEDKQIPKLSINQDAANLEMQMIEDKIQKSIQEFELLEQEKARKSSNLLGSFSELWKTELDW